MSIAEAGGGEGLGHGNLGREVMAKVHDEWGGNFGEGDGFEELGESFFAELLETEEAGAGCLAALESDRVDGVVIDIGEDDEVAEGEVVIEFGREVAEDFAFGFSEVGGGDGLGGIEEISLEGRFGEGLGGGGNVDEEAEAFLPEDEEVGAEGRVGLLDLGKGIPDRVVVGEFLELAEGLRGFERDLSGESIGEDAGHGFQRGSWVAS